MSAHILLNALLSGALLGGLYVVVSNGLAITFGLLDIPNVAHPTFIVLGAYAAHFGNSLGLDPVFAGVLAMPIFYVLGVGLYRLYYSSFEARGRTNTLQSFTFFFGVALVLQVSLILLFGVDLVSVAAPYIGHSIALGNVVLPNRMAVPFCAGIVVGLGTWIFLAKTRAGLAVRAVAYDATALKIIGLNPLVVKSRAFGLATATAAVAGAALIVVGPVDPFSGEQYIGRAFAVVVLGGVGSIPGTVMAALAIGILESLVIAYLGATWAPGVAFAALLATLALRPSGLLGAVK